MLIVVAVMEPPHMPAIILAYELLLLFACKALAVLGWKRMAPIGF